MTARKHTHRPIRGGKRLFFLNSVAFRKWFEGGRDQTERVKLELELRSRRARFDLLMQSMQALAHFFRLQDRHCLLELRRFEIQQQRNGDRL